MHARRTKVSIAAKPLEKCSRPYITLSSTPHSAVIQLAVGRWAGAGANQHHQHHNHQHHHCFPLNTQTHTHMLSLAQCLMINTHAHTQQKAHTPQAHLLSTSSAVMPVRSAMSSHVSSGLGAAAAAAAAALAAAAAPARPPAVALAALPAPPAAADAAAERSARADAVRVGRFASGMPSRGAPLRFLSITLPCAHTKHTDPHRHKGTGVCK